MAEITNWLGIFVAFLTFVVQELCEITVTVVFNVCIFVLFLTRNSLMLLIKASYINVICKSNFIGMNLPNG